MSAEKYITDAVEKMTQVLTAKENSFPTEFDGGAFMMQKAAKVYKGPLTDMKLEPYIPNNWPNVDEVRHHEVFYFSEARIKATETGQLLPPMNVLMNKATERPGEWHQKDSSEELRVFAFVCKLAGLE